MDGCPAPATPRRGHFRVQPIGGKYTSLGLTALDMQDRANAMQHCALTLPLTRAAALAACIDGRRAVPAAVPVPENLPTRGNWRCGSALLLGATLLSGTSPAGAQGPVEVPPTWGGDLSSRPRLTGDWSGSRDELGSKGVVVDIDLVLTPQSVMSGGKDTGTVAWGNATYTLNVDTGKAGWWPGGFFNVKGDSGFGNSGYGENGAFVPASTATLVPDPLEPGSGLESATFTQFLSPRFGLLLGKFYTLDLAHGEFYGNYQTQFMNMALSVPMTTALVPISAFGGGAVFLPVAGVSVLGLALDPSGTVMDNDVGDAFDDGVLFLGAATVKVSPRGLAGHQSLTGVWSDKTRLSLDQDPSNLARFLLTERFPRLGDPGRVLTRILERHFPGLLVPVQPANREDSTWMIGYALDQYLWQPGGDSGRGIGIFFNVGATDGNPNPVEYSYVAGIGGNGVVPGRPDDSFGIGWARTQFSDDFVPFLRQRLDLGLDHEDAIEMYYNAAITPWLRVSPSIQIIDSGLERSLDSNDRLAELDTAAVFFLRTQVRF